MMYHRLLDLLVHKGVFLGSSNCVLDRYDCIFDACVKAYRGRSVLALQVSDLGDVGRAWVINTVPYILLDPELLRTLPRPLQIFFYAHECAHHRLGHWYSPTGTSEKEADCWAIEYGRDHGIFRRQTVVDFEPWLAKSRGSAFGHLPGRERVRHLLACFDGPVETAQQ